MGHFVDHDSRRSVIDIIDIIQGDSVPPYDVTIGTDIRHADHSIEDTDSDVTCPVAPVRDGRYPDEPFKMFTSMYWRSNGNRNADFSFLTDGDTMTLFFRSYYKNDLVGFIWDTVDVDSHPSQARIKTEDYRGFVWEFEIEVTGDVASLNAGNNRSTTITITTEDNEYYVPLINYAVGTVPTDARKVRVRLDFDNIRQFTTDPLIPVDKITNILISVVSKEFDGTDLGRLAAPLEGSSIIKTLSSEGKRIRRNALKVGKHYMGICTSYDDQHNISPERIIAEATALGYTGWLNHYMGMSRYPNKENRAGTTDEVVCKTTGQLMNTAAREWHMDLARRARAAGFDLSFSISFEMFSPFAIPEWCQVEKDGTLGITGYTPTSYFLSPGNDDAMDYLKAVFLEGAELMNGITPIRMQVGEPWWWWNTSARSPCFYDDANKAKFKAWSAAKGENGGLGFDFYTFVNVDDPTTDPAAVSFKLYLEEALGLVTTGLRSHVRATYPNAEMSVLFFLPTILSPYSGMMKDINYPQEYYKYPNFDTFVWEAYDQHWGGVISQIPIWAQQLRDELGYPDDKIEYLSGFIPAEDLLVAFGYEVLSDKYIAELAGRILGMSRVLRDDFGTTRQAYWAHTQITQTSMVIHPRSKCFELAGRVLHPEITIDAPVLYFRQIGGGANNTTIPIGGSTGQTNSPKIVVEDTDGSASFSHNSVNEQDQTPITGVITITPDSGIGSVSFRGLQLDLVTLAAGTVSVPIQTTYGVLTITSYTPATGVFTYSYVVQADPVSHVTGGVLDTIEIVVTGVTATVMSNTLDITILSTGVEPVGVGVFEEKQGVAEITDLEGYVWNSQYFINETNRLGRLVATGALLSDGLQGKYVFELGVAETKDLPIGSLWLTIVNTGTKDGVTISREPVSCEFLVRPQGNINV